MNRRPIGYYVHHHGAGHRLRAAAIAEASDWPIVLLGTGVGEAGIDLPDDRQSAGRFDGRDAAPSRPRALHYAPLDQEGIRRRVARITTWIAREKPALMVVDVSVEVAMLARLASVETIYVRLNGTRGDAAHEDAFRGASALLAPYHASLEPPWTPKWVLERTRYFPGIARPPGPGAADGRRILVVFGRGGPPGDIEALVEAARACPEWQWRVLGRSAPASRLPGNLEFAGWVDEPEREIALAALVVGAAGDGLVSSVMAADRPFLCIPEERPFGEQYATALRLEALGAALVLSAWPPGTHWPGLIQRTLSMPGSARRRLHDSRGAQKAAGWLAQRAEEASFQLERSI